ncbi:MAG: RNA polymerase sporulation sigma factor SigK [Lachnospiraceae bacterium]|nr:RNA polymerase sporulation sigma factor SigK [Lachnospiraceae bacterium]MDD7024666.1 RNA polymerase sporulation sigma factor SigK [Oscillospiraceae bacterium]MDY5541486.1 RNA polymerase sporulation sigma factor SigK [Lachnospiraceae bacterium]
MKTFPKPLTADEEREYLKRYREGDPAAKDVLIERNLRLVAHIVKKYQHPEEDMEDLISIGTIGLIKAVMTFDDSKGSRLATYAARCIDNELLMMLRSRKKTARDVSLYEPIGTDREGNEISLLDIMEHTAPGIVEKIDLKDNIIHLYRVLDQVLSERESQVIRMRYGLYNRKSMTQREVADILGISRSYVSRIEKNAIQKLRKDFQKDFFQIEKKTCQKTDY